MMTRDERLRYWEKIEAAMSSPATDPEMAVEYASARRAWDECSAVSGSRSPQNDTAPATGSGSPSLR